MNADRADGDRRDAEAALREADREGLAIRRRLAYQEVGPILILWGVIWVACFLTAHYRPGWTGWAWTVGDVVGILGTIYLGWVRPLRGPVRSEAAREEGRRLFAFWVAVLAYGVLTLIVLAPWRHEQFLTFVVTFIMFAYVVMGLWLRFRFMVVLGLVVTAAAVVGYFLSPRGWGTLNLWLAATGGAALLGSGLYLTVQARRGGGHG